MNLLETFEELNINKSKKLVYEPHDVICLKFDTHKRIGIAFQNIAIDIDQTKKYRGFYTRSIKEKKELYM